MNKNGKHKLLAVLFAEAKKVGLSAETLREYIAPEILGGKRLSEATSKEVFRVITHITDCRDASRDTALRVPTRGQREIRKRYESSRTGLLEEIADLARARYGADFIVPLNNLCARFGESDGYRKMRIAGLKELKKRLIELQKEDPLKPQISPITQIE
ncbi:MAG: hypothetical protein DWB56_14805 [Candidatus Jettenia sp.]|uniref:Uncharacterized protein n=1 Tax=Candidatus Jettenia caeni TaxID=247490 RepID=I3ILS5_9BACT|nr:hypothetical protein [Candidatus Jettenia sp. AMX1]KAA0243586.1 MAG: hypothetical protein EDM70_10040 [Candidatus Brocadia sp. AMX2]MBC6930202.1 hypothetical protein [Candidatus Jettenia sp.]RIJ88474.1 MAG: hypothetical protein DCC43_16130 [Candidatus Brocadia sp.]GAB62670.1 hypothetical protein KSU1_C1074 [Candidatus Jettenia caeni]MCQ3927076.1 hypothetical protein [Candidatus Jettenia sp.]